MSSGTHLRGRRGRRVEHFAIGVLLVGKHSAIHWPIECHSCSTRRQKIHSERVLTALSRLNLTRTHQFRLRRSIRIPTTNGRTIFPPNSSAKAFDASNAIKLSRWRRRTHYQSINHLLENSVGMRIVTGQGRHQLHTWVNDWDDQKSDKSWEGAFGIGYRAFDPQLEREVALKVPRPGTFDGSDAVERFMREAKAAAQPT
jgi:hypothetical protein